MIDNKISKIESYVEWYDSKQNKNQESNNFYFGISDNVFIIPMGFINE